MLGLYEPLRILNSHETDDFVTRCVCLSLDANRTISNLTNYDNDECADVIMEIPKRISSIKLNILNKNILMSELCINFPNIRWNTFYLYLISDLSENQVLFNICRKSIILLVSETFLLLFSTSETRNCYEEHKKIWFNIILWSNRLQQKKKNNSITNIWTNTILVSTSVRLYIWILWYKIQKAKIPENLNWIAAWNRFLFVQIKMSTKSFNRLNPLQVYSFLLYFAFIFNVVYVIIIIKYVVL